MKSNAWTLRKVPGPRTRYDLIRHCVDKDEHLGYIVRVKQGWKARHEEHSRFGGDVLLTQALILTGPHLRVLAAHLYNAAMSMPMQGRIQ